MEFKAQTIPQLEATIEEATRILNEKKDVRRAELHAELESLGKPVKATPAKAKLTAKYRSKANPLLTWAGRGQAPTWLVDEMKASGQPRDAFKVSGSATP